MKKFLLILIPLLLLSALIMAGCVFTRLGYETPTYTVTLSDGKYEVRSYATLTVVSVPMKSTVGASDGSFMRLFRYISKDNADAAKISMTTPVLMTMEGKEARMSFVMPAATVAKGVPLPKGADMKVETLPAGRFAVYRFAGSLDEQGSKAAEKLLRDWITANKLSSTGAVVVAGYDPPFTPPAMRRNEILLRLTE